MSNFLQLSPSSAYSLASETIQCCDTHRIVSNDTAYKMTTGSHFKQIKTDYALCYVYFMRRGLRQMQLKIFCLKITLLSSGCSAYCSYLLQQRSDSGFNQFTLPANSALGRCNYPRKLL